MSYGGMWDMKRLKIKSYNRFGNFWYDGDTCPDCSVELSLDNTDYNGGRNGPTAGKYAGQQKKIRHCNADYLKNMEDRKRRLKKSRLLNTAPAQEYFDWVDSQKESVVKQRVVSIKSRNYSEYAKLKELYNYTCQVEGCYETEVQFAHILKHSLDNSVDNHTNGWCICCNHHNAYDSNRMIVDVDGNFVRYNVHGDKVEEGRIIYHDRHEVNPQFIILAREWHDDTKK